MSKRNDSRNVSANLETEHENGVSEERNDVQNRTVLEDSTILAVHHSIPSAESSQLDRQPGQSMLTTSKVYSPLSPHVLAPLMAFSVFGVLARLGLQALFDFDGQAVFPIIWAQALGCFIMGVLLAVKEPLGCLSVSFRDQ